MPLAKTQRSPRFKGRFIEAFFALLALLARAYLVAGGGRPGCISVDPRSRLWRIFDICGFVLAGSTAALAVRHGVAIAMGGVVGVECFGAACRGM